MNQKRQPLSGQWQELFQNPASLSEKSRGTPLSLNKSLIQDYDISGVQLFYATFDDTEWTAVTGQKSQLINVIFKNSNLADVDFSFSALTDVTFENVTFVGARFHHSTFVNVRFENCKILDPQKDHFRSFSGLKAQGVKIVNSKLQNLTFFESQGDFLIEKSQFEDVSFSGLTFPSSMNINSSQLENVKFDNSNFTTFTVIDSQLKNTSVQDSHIGKVVISNSSLDISFSGSVLGEVRVSEIRSELLGFVDASASDMSISFCKEGSDISLTGLKFNNLKIENCNHVDFMVPEGVGKNLMISNSILKVARFRAMAVDHLLIDNVEFTGETNFDGAQAKKSEIHNIKKSPGAIITATGSNIRLY